MDRESGDSLLHRELSFVLLQLSMVVPAGSFVQEFPSLLVAQHSKSTEKY